MGIHVGTTSVILRNFFDPERCKCTMRYASVRDKKGVCRYMGNVYFQDDEVAKKALLILCDQSKHYELDTDAYLYTERAGIPPERIDEFHYRHFTKREEDE